MECGIVSGEWISAPVGLIAVTVFISGSLTRLIDAYTNDQSWANCIILWILCELFEAT
jgi:hypothetical protein